MEDSGAILCQLSALKDMLDQVNEEIEAREIRSEIVKCSEFERALAIRESELMKTVYVLQFEIKGLMAVDDESRTTRECLDKEVSCIRMKQDEILGRMNNKRGEDTRKNFTDHLYTAMKQAKIRTFRDDDAMDRGKLIKPELKKAIHQSAISVIVFSENYATSKWCLDEVLMIIEEHETSSSKHEVVPVFYKVDPSDVRNQRGSFKKAFDVYDDIIKGETDLQKKREWLEKVGAWRNSLRKAATFTGMVSTDGYEARFIIDIVNVIRKKLEYKALYIEEKLVGIEDHVVEIESWLQDPSPNAVILLIDGMGGIGKTTIAKCIYNSNFGNYGGSCFLANVSETSNQPGGLLRLQTQLLSKISKMEKEETIWNVHEGTSRVTDALCNNVVLIILDDVTTLQQIDVLLGRQWFSTGSKVIITTRHKWLLTAFKDHLMVRAHSVRTLSTADAIEVFSLYAFRQDQPMAPHILRSERLVHQCMGLPLALKVLGSSLRGCTEQEWEDKMRKLEAIPNPEIQKVLQISYETLEDDKDKDLFLHVACFFVGEEKDYIVKILDQCDLYPVVGIRNLTDRCLLYVDNGRVMMHQLIKKMGREIVRQESPEDPGKRSRLWHHQDCFNVLQDHAGTEKVEGLMLDMQKIEEAESTAYTMMNLEKSSFEVYDGTKMHGYIANFEIRAQEKIKSPQDILEEFLRKVAHGNNANLEIGALEKTKNPEMRSFDDYPGKNMHGNNVNFEIGALEKMRNLMLLQLNNVTFSGKCKKLPKKLRLLSWHGCSLEAIPGDSCLEKLVVLDMRYSKLKCVWDGFKFIGSLKILNLSHSVELIETPDFRGLPGLESLILKGCLSLIKVGESIAYLKELILLDLTNCRSLRVFPCLPTSLVSLQMSGCPNLDVLGRVQCLHSVSPFSLLEDVDISYCNLFDNCFPNDWSSLVSLWSLNIDGNNVTSLPKCIQTLPTIGRLHAGNCSNIQSIVGLPKSVNVLNINNNKSLEKVQPGQNSRIVVYCPNCPKLCDMEGRYMIQSIDKVETKVIRYLGLTLGAGEGMELGLQVLHEFGIFSTFVSGKQIPSCFMYKKLGPQISFRVPGQHNSSTITGFNMCVVLSRSSGYDYAYLNTQVYNKTRDLKWTYIARNKKFRKYMEHIAWLSVWRCGNMLEAGDEIVISVTPGPTHQFYINLLYEDHELDGETKEARHVNASHQILWTDRMDKDISNYVCNGTIHVFQSDN